jgi:ABC-2 type transport system ATP-binding protein
MLKLIREMKQDHDMSVVLCSHLLRDVEEVCDEAVILKDGRLVHHSNLEEERRTNRRFVELEVAGDDSGLALALREHGADGVAEGGGRWRIVLPPGIEIGLIWRLAAEANLDVHRLTHRHDSLEEIFLKAIGHLQPTPPSPAAPAEEVAVRGRS